MDGMSTEERNAIVERHWEAACGEVERLLKRIKRQDLYDDVLSHVAESVISVVEGFDQSLSDSIETHLTYNVRRATLEAVRSGDGRRRRARECRESMEAARGELSHQLGHRPTDGELAEFLGVPESDVIEFTNDDLVNGRRQNAETSSAVGPDTQKEDFDHLLSGLPAEQAEVLTHYHIGGYTLSEVAEMYSASPVTIHGWIRKAHLTIRIRRINGEL